MCKTICNEYFDVFNFILMITAMVLIIFSCIDVFDLLSGLQYSDTMYLLKNYNSSNYSTNCNNIDLDCNKISILLQGNRYYVCVLIVSTLLLTVLQIKKIHENHIQSREGYDYLYNLVENTSSKRNWITIINVILSIPYNHVDFYCSTSLYFNKWTFLFWNIFWHKWNYYVIFFIDNKYTKVQ